MNVHTIIILSGSAQNRFNFHHKKITDSQCRNYYQNRENYQNSSRAWISNIKFVFFPKFLLWEIFINISLRDCYDDTLRWSTAWLNVWMEKKRWFWKYGNRHVVWLDVFSQVVNHTWLCFCFLQLYNCYKNLLEANIKER